MGIYLGQLPPPEIARLKAELAETLVANFCYPRFFDPRTQSLRMRPVDNAKRQEVWLYLSSVDFTAWSRVDLMSPDFQHQIERLFILFVQRNRSFFREQGRRRMSDVRMLINASAVTVAQRLRSHVTGQKPAGLPFGSPRPVVSWSAAGASGSKELSWEQISASTKMLQQQLQEARGEIKLSSSGEGRAYGGNVRRPARPQMPGEVPAAGVPSASGPVQTPPLPVQANGRTNSVVPPGPLAAPAAASAPPAKSAPPLSPQASAAPASPVAPAAPVLKGEPAVAPAIEQENASGPVVVRATGNRTAGSPLPPVEMSPRSSTSPVPVPGRTFSQPPPTAQAAGAVAGARETPMMLVGEDDVAIFEQMRHQLIVWLRIEAVTSGLEISGLAPAQLLELLRQHGRLDETRLQVVSTLLNLANQVIKTGLVSILDYKQALMFHLMHTRR